MVSLEEVEGSNFGISWPSNIVGADGEKIVVEWIGIFGYSHEHKEWKFVVKELPYYSKLKLIVGNGDSPRAAFEDALFASKEHDCAPPEYAIQKLRKILDESGL